MNKPSGSKSQLVFILCFVWIAAVVVGYYYVHKPINFDLVSSLGLVGLDLGAGLAVVVLTGGLGRKLLPLHDFHPLERAAVQAALGAAILGLFWLVLGIAHLFNPWAAWAVLLTALLLLRKVARAWIADLCYAWQSVLAAGKLEKSFAAGVGVLVLFQLAISLAPPLKWDALTYHLELPKQYLQAGSLVFLPQIPFWGYPQLTEMLYTFAAGLHRAQTAAVVNWGFGVVFLLGLVGLTNSVYANIRKEQANENPGWVAATALISGMTARYLLGWSYADLMAALFGLAALSQFLRWMDAGEASWLRWAVLFGSAAVSVKWTEGVLLMGLFLYLPVLRKSQRVSFRLLLEVAAIALAVVAPWLLKNWLVTGSPLFPYLLPTAGYDAARLAANNFSTASEPLWQRFLLPFALTFTGIDSAAGYSSDLGALLLLLGLPGLAAFWREPKVRLLPVALFPAAICISLVSIWVGFLYQPRIYFALLPMAALPAGLGWMALKELRTLTVRMNRIIGVVVWMVLAFCFLQDTLYLAQLNPFEVFVSQSASGPYLARGTGVYAAAVTRVNQLPAGAKVLMLWEPRGLYMPPDVQADLWIDRFQTDFRASGSAEKIVAGWCAQGFQYVLIYKFGEDLIKPAGGGSSALWEAYQQTHTLLRGGETISNYYDLFSLPCAAPQ